MFDIGMGLIDMSYAPCVNMCHKDLEVEGKLDEARQRPGETDAWR